MLGVTIDNKLRSAIHLLNVDKNTNIKLKKLARFQKYMTAEERSLIFFFY